MQVCQYGNNYIRMNGIEVVYLQSNPGEILQIDAHYALALTTIAAVTTCWSFHQTDQ